MNSFLSIFQGMFPNGMATLVSLIGAIPATLSIIQSWRYSKNEKVHDYNLISKWARLTISIMIVSILVTLLDLFAIILVRDSEGLNVNPFILIPCIMIVSISVLISILQIRKNGWWAEFSTEGECGETISILVLEIFVSVMTYLSSTGAALTIFSSKVSLAYILQGVYIIIVCFLVETIVMLLALYAFAWHKRTDKYNKAKVFFLDGETITIKYKSYRRRSGIIEFEIESTGKNAQKIDIKDDGIKRIEFFKPK